MKSEISKKKIYHENTSELCRESDISDIKCQKSSKI